MQKTPRKECLFNIPLKVIFIGFMLIFINPLFAQENESSDSSLNVFEETRSPHEVGIYFKDYFPVARMHNHSYNFVGGGLSYSYHSPLKIPVFAKAQNVFGSYLNIGFSGRIDVVGALANDDYISNWFTFNGFAGAFLQWVINNWFEIQPSIEYGLQFDTVHSSREADGLYVNQALQFSPSFKFRPESINKDGLSIEVAPLYTLSFEPDGVAHYFGLRVGGMYRIGGKNYSTNETKIEYIEKEVIKEVPVEKIIEKEVIKEIPVEKIVEKEVIKEVPVEVIKYIEVPAKENSDENKTEIENEDFIIDDNETTETKETTELSEETEYSFEEETPTENISIENYDNNSGVEIILSEKVELAENADGSLAINIPNLNFVSNSSELIDSLTNNETINQVFTILNDELYKEYKCIITGYVNPDNEEWTEEEKTLAIERAESVKNELVKLGADNDRFTVKCGSGKTDNKEFNRRVEFKLIK